MTTVRDEESLWNPFCDAEGELQQDRDKSSISTAYTLALDWAPAIPTGSMNLHLDDIYAENTGQLEPGYLASFHEIGGVGEDDKP